MVTLRYKPMKSGKHSAYLDIYYKDAGGKGSRVYEFLNIHTSKDYYTIKRIAKEDTELMLLANSIRAKREIEVSQSVNGYKPKKSNENLNFISYAEQYSKINNDSTANRLLFNLKKYASENLTFADLTFNWIEGFKRHLQSKLKQNSVRGYLWKLKQILRHAVKSGVIDNHNFEEIEIPTRADTNKTTLTIEEVKLLEKTPVNFNSQIKEAFLLACFCGLRLSDIKNLQYSQITNDKIKFTPQKTKNKIIEIPLTEQAKQILSKVKRKSDNDFVFYDLPKRQTIGKHLEIWGLKAGLKKHLHFHSSRHSFATIGLTYGIDVYTMKELLGHSKIEQTQVYAKIVDEKKQNEVAKFPTL